MSTGNAESALRRRGELRTGIWNGQHGFSGVKQQQMMQEAHRLGLNDTGAGTSAADKTGQLAIAKGPRARPRKTTSTRSRQQLWNQGGPKFGPAAAAQHLRRAPCFPSLIYGTTSVSTSGGAASVSSGAVWTVKALFAGV